MAKRLFDLFFSIVGLVVLLPVFAGLAIAVKLDDGGPVFFRQTRVGQNGTHFQILKFRTMTDRVEPAGPKITVSGDKRITQLGGWLRKTKLDELPQLINVLAGDMSLVGPRPEVPHYMALYTAEQRHVILSVKPGMTDFAALELRNEEEILASYPDAQRAYVDVLMPRKFALYEKYVCERNLFVDAALVWRTVAAIVTRKAA